MDGVQKNNVTFCNAYFVYCAVLYQHVKLSDPYDPGLTACAGMCKHCIPKLAYQSSVCLVDHLINTCTARDKLQAQNNNERKIAFVWNLASPREFRIFNSIVISSWKLISHFSESESESELISE